VCAWGLNSVAAALVIACSTSIRTAKPLKSVKASCRRQKHLVHIFIFFNIEIIVEKAGKKRKKLLKILFPAGSET
jgi:hypothetical protein